MWREPTLTLKSDQERLSEGNMGGFSLCVPFKVDLLGWKPIDCVTLPRTVHKQSHKPRHTAGVCLFPSKHKMESVTHSSSHLRVLLGREGILRKGRYVLRWPWESHWVTGSGSTAIALFKMQSVDVFRGHISINHCMQTLPVEKRFPCKSLLTALIELTLVTEGMLNADGLLIVLSQEEINKRQQKCLAPSRARSQTGRWGGRTRVSFCLAVVAHYHGHKTLQPSSTITSTLVEEGQHRWHALTWTGDIADLHSVTPFTGEHGSIKERLKKNQATPLLLSLDIPKTGVCIQPRDPQADTGN